MNFLVLDDDPILLPLARRVLTQARPWKVFVATTVEEALALASTHPLDVLLVDASVGTSFAAVVGSLQAHPALAKAKIFALTAKVSALRTHLPVLSKDPGLATLVDQIEKQLVYVGSAAVNTQPTLVDRALEHAYEDSRVLVAACSLEDPHVILWGNRAWTEWNRAKHTKVLAVIDAGVLREGDRERMRLAAMEAIREGKEVMLGMNVKRGVDAVVSVHAKVVVPAGAARLWMIWEFAESPSIPPAHVDLLESMMDAVRSPLTEVRGSLGMLAGGLFGALDERVNELVELAILQLDRSMLFLDDAALIELASRDELKLSLQSTKVDELIALASASHEITSSERAVKAATKGSSLRVLVDSRRVGLALVALLEHARAFSNEGTTPVIRAEAREHCVRFTIAPGDGLIAARSATDVQPLLALRLRVARLIVELHHGRWGESSPGHHWIELPQSASGPSNTLRALAKEVVDEVRAELLTTLPTQMDTIASGFLPNATSDQLRRAVVTAHNLRGTAGSCGLGELGHCAGRLEDLLREVQKGARPLESTITEAMNQLTESVAKASR